MQDKRKLLKMKERLPLDSVTAVDARLYPMKRRQYTADEVVNILRKRQGERTQREFAAELGITQQYLCDLYARHRDPGDTVIDKLGMTRRTVYEEKAS